MASFIESIFLHKFILLAEKTLICEVKILYRCMICCITLVIVTR